MTPTVYFPSSLLRDLVMVADTADDPLHKDIYMFRTISHAFCAYR